MNIYNLIGAFMIALVPCWLLGMIWWDMGWRKMLKAAALAFGGLAFTVIAVMLMQYQGPV